MKTEIILDILGGLFEELEYQTECDHTHKLTEEFIQEYYEDYFEEMMEWIKNHGGCCCDCEIAMNIMGSEQGLLAKLWHMTNKDSMKAVLIEKLFILAEKK